MVAILLRKCLVIRDCLEFTTTMITSHPYPLNAKKPAVKDETPKHTFTYTACAMWMGSVSQPGEKYLQISSKVRSSKTKRQTKVMKNKERWRNCHRWDQTKEEYTRDQRILV